MKRDWFLYGVGFAMAVLLIVMGVAFSFYTIFYKESILNHAVSATFFAYGIISFILFRTISEKVV